MKTESIMKEKEIPGAEERKLPEFNAMQRVKRRFFAMRNGDLAAQMAALGAAYQINFGLNLPQISEIARDFLPGGTEAPATGEGFDYADFARRLRANTSTRESMLIAPMLFPVESLDAEEAVAWAREVPTAEVADILCMKLLRRYAGAREIVMTLAQEDMPLRRYTAMRLLLNLLQTGQADVAFATPLFEAEKKRGCATTASVCRQIAQELEFMAD